VHVHDGLYILELVTHINSVDVKTCKHSVMIMARTYGIAVLVMLA
jgi:hypothetical protein